MPDGQGEMMDLLVLGLGAGAKGAIAGYVQKFAPEIGVDVAGLVSGFLLWKFGVKLHPLVAKFGAGVLIGSIGQFISNLVPAVTGGATATATRTTTTPPSLGQLALA